MLHLQLFDYSIDNDKESSDDLELYYVDAIMNLEVSPEERESELIRLKEESDKLKEWPKL